MDGDSEGGMTFWGPEGGDQNKIPKMDEGAPGQSEPEITSITDFWMGLFTKPEETLRREAKAGGLGDAIRRIAIVGFVLGLLWVLLALILAMAAPAAILIALILLFAIPLGLILVFLIGSGIYFVLAKILGGEGDFGTQSNLISQIFVFQFVVSIPLAFLNIIPCVGAIINLGFSLYVMYLNALSLSIAHKFSLLRAFVVVLIPVVIMVAIFIALWMLILSHLPASYSR